MTTAALPLTLSEAQFQTTVIDYALLRGWRVHHSLPAKTGKGWRTPLQGHPGLPDLVLARAGVVILAELKRHRATPSPDQRLWLAAIGGNARLWTPANWPEIYEELR
jgi:hypothetical protein